MVDLVLDETARRVFGSVFETTYFIEENLQAKLFGDAAPRGRDDVLAGAGMSTTTVGPTSAEVILAGGATLQEKPVVLVEEHHRDTRDDAVRV